MSTEQETTNSTLEKRIAGRGRKLTDAQRKEMQNRFLAAFAETGIISDACRVVGIDRLMIRYWQEHDLHNFAERYNQARAESDDAIRREIHRRAIEGLEKAVYDKNGKVVDTIYTYSDTLLIFLAKSRMPEFRDRMDLNVSSDEPPAIFVPLPRTEDADSNT